MKNNLLILLALFVIGLLVHFRSFQLVPYGDDWKFIYLHYSHEEKDLNFSNFPGIFSYLAPYGPAILTIGTVYQFFGKAYFVYYLIPLIFKILISFVLFLSLENISVILKQKNRFLNFLSALLFLVGFTGIQAIDWSMNMNVFIALFIFVLGLFFQIKYYINEKKSDLLLSFFLVVFSIIVAPTRLTPMVIILPLIDLILVFKKSYNFLRIFIFKNIIFAVLVFLFLQIGIFGNPGQINNSGLIRPFFNTFLIDPILSFGIFMHWVGATILPNYPSSGISKTALAGAVFVIILILSFFKSPNKWLIIGSLIYFIPLFLMWLSSTLLKIVDADSRHLVFPFLSLCFLIGLIFVSIGKAKKIMVFTLLVLIFAHVYSVERMYTRLISIGRGSNFIIPLQEKIMSHFPSPITEPKIIFLDFDDAAVQQSIEFGIGYRIAFLSGTRNINFLPKPFSNKVILIQKLNQQLNRGNQKDEIINNIYAFRLRKGEFSDITNSFQDELKREI